jgi:hypothetical protein
MWARAFFFPANREQTCPSFCFSAVSTCARPISSSHETQLACRAARWAGTELLHTKQAGRSYVLIYPEHPARAPHIEGEIAASIFPFHAFGAFTESFAVKRTHTRRAPRTYLSWSHDRTVSHGVCAVIAWWSRINICFCFEWVNHRGFMGHLGWGMLMFIYLLKLNLVLFRWMETFNQLLRFFIIRVDPIIRGWSLLSTRIYSKAGRPLPPAPLHILVSRSQNTSELFTHDNLDASYKL